MGPHTVTIWHRSTQETYTRSVITGCYWEDHRGEQLRKTGVSTANGVIIFLPITTQIKPEDYVAKGDIKGHVATAKDIIALGGLRVGSVDRYDFGGLAHIEVVAE